MVLKNLFEEKYTISAIMEGNTCPVEEILYGNIESQYQGNCDELLIKLERISNKNFSEFSNKLARVINKNPKIMELRQGQLRLVFFHGHNKTIVVCCEICKKKTNKADKNLVARAIQSYKNYDNAIRSNNLTILEAD
ncbi:type II toxin-antitoxin system RelE/ParE family toxin [Nitrosomonas ureae]|uniref:Phage derived protein Gp49-like n=1 Tax=Nitrosomonas ureae TaxID=44577 RepID=A0A286A249_9PROT|nr:type II toxin-antitoxin system RelE/ParE family toxin [Nitrosomonas ureae]SOD15987.1 Phage derived protein Gp49-like [Nitrosomonas ureae]